MGEVPSHHPQKKVFIYIILALLTKEKEAYTKEGSVSHPSKLHFSFF